MKDYLFKISLILAFVFSVATSVYASPIRPGSIYPYNDNHNEINWTEPDVVFDGRPDTGNIYGRYDQVLDLPDGDRPIPSAPVPEPLSLILFGMGMIGVGFLARYRTA
jgi:hypothetical protein